jgi:hypothetical protein
MTEEQNIQVKTEKMNIKFQEEGAEKVEPAIKNEEREKERDQLKRWLKDGPFNNHLPLKQRQQIITECVEELISPTELGWKYKCNPDKIRTWVRKAGHSLPKQYKKAM